jgi:hypothetical protein
MARLRMSLPEGTVSVTVEAAPVRSDTDQAVLVSFQKELPARPIEAVDPEDVSARCCTPDPRPVSSRNLRLSEALPCGVVWRQLKGRGE